jgi:hypothetical protein
MATSTTGQSAGNKHKAVSSKVRFLSSNFASVISVTCCFPLEVMKTRIQIQVSHIIDGFNMIAEYILGSNAFIKVQRSITEAYFNRRRCQRTV